MVRENRAFVAQAVTWAARQGIGQFIDLGAGLPASPAVHQTARAVLPSARVAYVDTDHVVLSHARALLATGDGVAAVAVDLTDPAAVAAHPELRAVIDLREPVCVILAAVLHFLGADAARAVTAGYARLIAPGSCMAVSVACYDDEALGKRLSAEYSAAMLPRPVLGGMNRHSEEVGILLAATSAVNHPGRCEAAILAVCGRPLPASRPDGRPCARASQ
jgi:O-methyltransferase involved in polyketide biosynthesis